MINESGIETIDDYLIKGKKYVRRDIHDKWGGSRQRGISVSAQYNYIFLLPSKKEKFGYINGWRRDGIYCYSGEGQEGKMDFNNHANTSLRDHERLGKRVFLFENAGSDVKFVDEMVYDGYHMESSKDKNGDTREIIVFELKRKNNNLKELLPIDESEVETESKLSQGLEEEEIEFEFELQFEKGNPQGKDAQSDGITDTDLLGRDVLVKELSDFYTEYTDSNQSSFYLGIFARWGMGKSSILKMLSNAINEKKSDENEYLVCKVDCSVFDKKDQLWIKILNQLIDEISKDKDKDKDKDNRFNFKWKFITFKTRFFAHNFWKWLKGKNRWISILGIGSIFGFILYKFMPLLMGDNPKLREVTFLITICTAVYTLVKSMSSIFKENVFLMDNRSTDNTYSKSVNEYRLLLDLLNNVPKKKDIKILLVLDELDRIHKDLLPDIIECIQLFKALNEERILEKQKNDNNETNNKSTISCVFSFNHDVLFPIIGRNISLEDKQLFIQSYKKYKGFVEGKDKDAYVDYYKLGKEYMDKYLDLSLYLEDSIDYRNLVDHLFDGKDKEIDYYDNDKGTARLIEWHDLESRELRKRYEYQEGVKDMETGNQSEYQEWLKVSEEDAPSFTSKEREIIKDIICLYASDVEPRKIIRLKNALLLLKKLNRDNENVMNIQKQKELQKFIIDFLEIDISDKNTEIAATVEELSSNEQNRYLKYTNYFIHNKD